MKEAARRRLLEAVDPIMAELIRLALHAESESVRVSAAKDALDRAGLQVKMLVESEVTVHDGDSDLDAEIRRLMAQLAGGGEGGTQVAADGQEQSASP